MNNIAGQIESICADLKAKIHDYDQVARFDETIRELGKLIELKKATYTLPLPDTIGKDFPSAKRARERARRQSLHQYS